MISPRSITLFRNTSLKKSKNKKNQTPLAIRLVKWLFPKLEKIAPSLANRYFIHIFFTPFHYNEPGKEREFLKTSKTFEITAANKRVQCYRWGTSGPKILLVHGWAGRTGQFREIIPRLIEAGFQVIAFDGTAHGRSEGRQTSVPEFSTIIKQVIHTEGEFAGVIGHSFGGIASLYAIAHGNDIPKLVMISSPTLPLQVINNFRRAIDASPNVASALDDYHIRNFGKPFSDFAGINSIKLITKPFSILVVQDVEDPEVAPENATELQKVYPAARVHFVTGLGHTRILRDEGVISTCLEFLKS